MEINSTTIAARNVSSHETELRREHTEKTSEKQESDARIEEQERQERVQRADQEKSRLIYIYA